MSRKFVIGKSLDDSGRCTFLQNEEGTHERWFDSEAEAEEFEKDLGDDHFVMGVDLSDDYLSFWG